MLQCTLNAFDGSIHHLHNLTILQRNDHSHYELLTTIV